MSEFQNCYTCLHRQVCRYIQAFNQLAALGSINNFRCRYYLAENQTNPKKNRRDVTNQNMNATIEKLSREATKERQEFTEPDRKTGICTNCGKERMLYRCDSCGKYYCGECGELIEELDLNGDSKTVFLCRKCGDSE